MPAYPHFLELCGAAVGSHCRLDIAAVDGLPIQRSLAFAISGLQLCRDFVEFSRRACCGRSRKNQCAPKPVQQIGRASGRERVCQYVSLSVVAEALKKKTNNKYNV